MEAPKRLPFSFAEREGFEPPVPLGTTVFKTVVIDHSTISPCFGVPKSGAKLLLYFQLCKFFDYFLFGLCIFISFAPLSCLVRSGFTINYSPDSEGGRSSPISHLKLNKYFMN